MSSSTEVPVTLATLATPELRAGTWTRFGDGAVLGDSVTERALASLAESTRDAARAQGYAVGWGEGRREAAARAQQEAEEQRATWAEAEQSRAAEHAAALAALGQATARLQETLAAVSADVEDAALALARELTEALVGHELRSGSAADVVRRALAVLPGDLPVTVRLHPEVAADSATEELTSLGARVVADPGLDPADAVVETDQNVVDLRMRAALARVLEVLA